MIISEKEMKNISADVTLSGCSGAWNVNISMRMEGQPKTLPLQFSSNKEEDNFADFRFTKEKQSYTEHKMPEAVNGYLPAMNGHVSIHVEQLDHDDEGILQHHDEEHNPHLTYLIVSNWFVLYFDVLILLQALVIP